VFTQIVVGADSSDTAREAVRKATELAKATGAQLHILTALNIETGPSRAHGGGYVEHDGPAKPLLDDLRSYADELGVECTLHHESGEPAEALIRVAADLGADLVVVGNRGMKGVRRVLGSVPNSVAHGAHCSVLILDTMGDA
jgi:nucleotide-binding universal stress UspA family protein